jgi:hypothetical protein
MRRIVLSCCAIVLAGCAKPEQKASDDSATASLAAGAVTPISLSEIAGTWAVKATALSGEGTVVDFQMITTAETSGWSINFPGRQPLPVRVVAVEADSVVTEAGPYESVLRKGVQVTTTTVTRYQNGALVGTTTARYSSGPDSVLHLRFEGTRVN